MANIIFMGTPDIAANSLKRLYEDGHNILAVVTNPDRPKGRGMKMAASPVKELAQEKGIEVLQPEKIRKNEEFIYTLKSINPDIICVVAFGKILPKEILEIPKLGCINLHASLLPKYRGSAPIQWSVLNGDKITGVTTMYMDEGMDTGDMILKEETPIGEDETSGELWNRISEIGAEVLSKTIFKIENGTAPRIKQPEGFTMAPMLTKEMAKINWKESNTKKIKNLVRGLNPIMGAYTILNGKKVKFWKVDCILQNEFHKNFGDVSTEKIKGAIPGQIIYANEKYGLYIKTMDGILSVIEIQGENSKRMNIKDFLRGNKILDMEVFE